MKPLTVEELVALGDERRKKGVTQVYPVRERSGSDPRVPGLPPDPCGYATVISGPERQAAGLSHVKEWHRCGHPQRPLRSEFVCPCAGCGPGCSGYATSVPALPKTEPAGPPMERLVLTHDRCPGDIVTMTALVRDLALTYPGRYAISVKTPARGVWSHNPYVVPEPADPKVPRRVIKLSYGDGIRRAGTTCAHFLTAWHTNFEKHTGVRVQLTQPKPDLHLGPEDEPRLVEGRYWVVLSGGKSDFTTKHWVYERHQAVVDGLRRTGIPIVQAGSKDSGHKHPRLTGALDLVGKTTLREFIRLIAQSEGVICTITAAMHIAAAFDKPCVVTAGGREEPWWEGYTNAYSAFGAEASGKVKVEHRYLHTVGLLDCCRTRGCWKNKVLATESDSNKSFCKRPMRVEGDQAVPECMAMITVNHVIEAVWSYYMKGVLPPIGTPPIITYLGTEKVEAPREFPAPLPVAPYPVLPLPPGPLPMKSSVPLPMLPPPPVSPPPVTLAPPPKLAVAATEGSRPAVAVAAPVKPAFDHPAVGGKFTLCTLLYGDYFPMHRRHLDALVKTCPAGRVDLRIGSNELGAQALQYVSNMVRDGRASAHYRHKTNDKKYPVMREMFWDEKRPITTKWVIWTDDDTMVDRNDEWLALLSQQIVNNPGVDMFGPLRVYKLTESQPQWIRSAPWFRGRQFRDKSSKPQPNADKVHFAVGAFWALRVEAMRAADIPCRRLGHNGGDWTIGEQLWQAGFKLKNWSGGKEVVEWSAVPRRGLSETHPGTRARKA